MLIVLGIGKTTTIVEVEAIPESGDVLTVDETNHRHSDDWFKRPLFGKTFVLTREKDIVDHSDGFTTPRFSVEEVEAVAEAEEQQHHPRGDILIVVQSLWLRVYKIPVDGDVILIEREMEFSLHAKSRLWDKCVKLTRCPWDFELPWGTSFPTFYASEVDC